MTNSSLRTICPNETVVIYCITKGTGLHWILPITAEEEELAHVSFFSTNDAQNLPVQTRGPIIAWWDSNQPLRSHIEIPYSPELSSTTVSCESGNKRLLHLTYKLAGTANSIIFSCLCFDDDIQNNNFSYRLSHMQFSLQDLML